MTCSSSIAHADSGYKFTDLAELYATGNDRISAGGINDNGQIVAKIYFEPNSDPGSTYIFDNGNVIPLSTSYFPVETGNNGHVALLGTDYYSYKYDGTNIITLNPLAGGINTTL